LFDFTSGLQFGQDPSTGIIESRQLSQSLESQRRDIYDSHRHRTFALAYYMTGSELEAERILTNTFIRAFRATREPKGEDVDRALLEELRLRSYLRLDALPSTPPSANSVDQSAGLIGCSVKRTELEEAIRDLPAMERLLFLLRDVEGYAPAAIGQLLDMPEAQVQRGVFAARIHLRRILAESQGQRHQDLAA
jgi:RNA polymerase sigma-70 factor, ECF subfamily